MIDTTKFYINGKWTTPHGSARKDLVNPADLSIIGQVVMGTADDATAAIAAAKAAFPSWSQVSVAERLGYLRKIAAALVARNDEIADAISAEMGAPLSLSRNAQAPSGAQHFDEIVRSAHNHLTDDR